MSNKSEHFGKLSQKTALKDPQRDLARAHGSSLDGHMWHIIDQAPNCMKQEHRWDTFTGTVIEIEASMDMCIWIWLWIPDQPMMWSSFVLFTTSIWTLTRSTMPWPRMSLLIASWGQPVNSLCDWNATHISLVPDAMILISTAFFPRLADTCK